MQETQKNANPYSRKQARPGMSSISLTVMPCCSPCVYGEEQIELLAIIRKVVIPGSLGVRSSNSPCRARILPRRDSSSTWRRNRYQGSRSRRWTAGPAAGIAVGGDIASVGDSQRSSFGSSGFAASTYRRGALLVVSLLTLRRVALRGTAVGL